MSRVQSIALSAITAAVVTGPFLALALADRPAPPSALRPVVNSESVRAVEVQYRPTFGGRLHLTWGPPPVAIAPAMRGTVVTALVGPGDVVREGDVVAKVDNVSLLAAKTAFPLYRPLGIGDTGDDVAELQQFLVRTGLLDGEAALELGTVDQATQLAIEELGRRVRAVPGSNSAFDPAWLAWLTQPEIVVTTTGATVGGPAPGAGAVLVAGNAELSAATLDLDEVATPSLNGDWVFTVDGHPPVEVTLNAGALAVASIARLSGELTSAEPTSAEVTVEVSAEAAGAVRAASLPASSVVFEINGSAQICARASDGRSWSSMPLPGAMPSGGAVVVTEPSVIDAVLSTDVLAEVPGPTDVACP